MNDPIFDIAIIGAGPAGYVSAIRAGQLGLKTVLIEESLLGGICLNWGCIPTKALLHSSKVNRLIENADSYGMSINASDVNLQKIVERSRGISEKLSKGVAYLLKKNQVKVIKGRGKVLGRGKISTVTKNNKKTEISTKNIVIATGARPRVLPGLEPDGKFIWTYFEALTPKFLPKSCLVIGGGAIGVEFASFFHAIGSEITIVESLDRILPNEDTEISALAKKHFEIIGINVLTLTKISKIKKNANNVTCTVNSKDNQSTSLDVDVVISAVGVVGNIEDLGLENTTVKVKQGQILTDEYNLTDEPGIYAIGDVAGPPWLAHKAEHEGVICIEKIAKLNPLPIEKNRIPGCTYCHPQVASIGLTEEAALRLGHQVKVGRFPFLGNGRAMATGDTNGLVKTIFDSRTGQLLGAHMIGEDVTELIHGFSIAIGLETTEEELMRTIFPHPTLSEAIHESVLDAYDKAIHI